MDNRKFVLIFAELLITATLTLGAHESLLEVTNAPVPYALSPVYLQYLENVETRLVSLLQQNNFFDGIHNKVEKSLQRYLSDYESSVRLHHERGSNNPNSKNATEDAGNYISSNPILALQMINRFANYFQEKDVFTTIFGESPRKILPNSRDAEDAMEGLLRLQYIYDLDAHQLANGFLHKVQTEARLTTRECFELGKLAQDFSYFSLALQWYDVTLQRLRNSQNGTGGSDDLQIDSVLDAIRETVEEHNEDHLDYSGNIEDGDMYGFATPIDSSNSNYSEIAHLSLRNSLTEQLTGKVFDTSNPKYFPAIEANMIALCAGKNLQSETVKSKLKCYFDTSKHPYWKINPLKIEVLSESPRILQMYDIFSDTWISYLKNKSHTELVRAPQPPDATERTGVYSWFNDSVIPELPVSKVVSFITGLNVEGEKAAEELQVAAYGFGAHVAPHHDSFDLGDEEEDEPEYSSSSSGKQVLTFLIYLNEVELGGRTAFPLVGISIKPVKNSAVLWYTKKKNGDVDNRTLHAACPVIKGHKWIATKWPRIGENFLRRPCGLRPDE